MIRVTDGMRLRLIAKSFDARSWLAYWRDREPQAVPIGAIGTVYQHTYDGGSKAWAIRFDNHKIRKPGYVFGLPDEISTDRWEVLQAEGQVAEEDFLCGYCPSSPAIVSRLPEPGEPENMHRGLCEGHAISEGIIEPEIRQQREGEALYQYYL